MAMHWQQPLPAIYNDLSPDELRFRVREAKEQLGDRLCILGHHYQVDDVIRHADASGDSLKLSQIAARVAVERDVEFVVFCGVHFMAETADILTDPAVHVILPDMGAGCSMADMADIDQTHEAWEQMTSVCGDQTIVPITYMNSSADIKSFVGEHGGAVCTSSNARAVLEWALKGGAVKGHTPEKKVKILFFPDQHLGRNTAAAMGYDPKDDMVLWDPRQGMGGNDDDSLRNATFVLWKGHCSVHALFRPEHVDQAREKVPDIKVLVHPECRKEVVDKADMAGSTAYIVKQVKAAEPGTAWAIGTEVHLVQRLKSDHPEQTIFVLSDCQCLCTTMTRIDLPHLCYVLESLAAGEVVNEVRVDDETRKWSTVALDRMLEIVPSATAPAGNPLNKDQPTSTVAD
ncbi:MAG: quinolinate synthase NadA [Planctomycetota bacterium]